MGDEPPAGYNQAERKNIAILESERLFALERADEKRRNGRPDGFERSRAAALEWALVEISKSRAALTAARKAAP